MTLKQVAVAGLIYEDPRSESLNGHQAGLKAFQGKRLAVFEELNQKKTLDIARIKEVGHGPTALNPKP